MYVQVIKPEGWKGSIKVDSDKLWMEIREGSEEALAKLFCSYYSHLFNYGFKIVSKEALVKDAIQELFLTLWNKRNQINEAYSVKSYLFHSLRRILLRTVSKQKNRTDRNRTYVDNFFEEIYNIEELMIHFETERNKKQQLAEAIDSLSKRQKEAIFLKFFEGLSNREIATVMEINRQSVYNHVSSAIRKLQNFVRV